MSTLNKLLNTLMGFITSEAICFPVIGKPGIEINIRIFMTCPEIYYSASKNSAFFSLDHAWAVLAEL